MNQTALITGASSGIGKAFAHKLAEKGYDVILVARSQPKLDELAEELKRLYSIKTYVITIDLSKEFIADEINAQVRHWDLHVDFLVNNAGFGSSGEFLSNDRAENHQQVMLNVASVVDLTNVFLPAMVEKEKGTIINLGSIVSFQPMPYMAVYGATKAFVLSFSEALWEEYRAKGIKILALCPGATKTNFFNIAGDVIVGQVRTTEQVVETAFKSLAKGKSFVIDGRQNYVSALFPRLLPRKAMLKAIAGMLRKKKL